MDVCLCENCIHCKEKNYFFIGKNKLNTHRCKIYTRQFLANVKKCKYHNVDISNEKICINCKYFLGGGDWGLACLKDYYALPDGNSKACRKFEKIES